MSVYCSLLEYKNLSMMIMDAPSNSNVSAYLRELKKNNVQDIVRVCDPTYKSDEFMKAGISIHDWQFPDGEPPPPAIIAKWLTLLKQVKKEDTKRCVAVHCVAGLGRAPVLVAISLIEEGMKPEDAIEFIRNKRKGAINTRQLKWLHKYKPKKTSSGCIIS